MSNQVESLETYERHADHENSMWYRGDLFTYLAEGKDTGGRTTVIEFAPKRGLEPPPHTHLNEDEALYIIEGEMSFRVGEQTFEGKAGSYVFMPRGIQHEWHIHTPEARLLMVFTPSGMENFFKALGDPVVGEDLHNAPQTRPNMAQLRALADQYGLIFPPPKA
jgi:quercetin dioxygenase-like cupin family protein